MMNLLPSSTPRIGPAPSTTGLPPCPAARVAAVLPCGRCPPTRTGHVQALVPPVRGSARRRRSGAVSRLRRSRRGCPGGSWPTCCSPPSPIPLSGDGHSRTSPIRRSRRWTNGVGARGCGAGQPGAAYARPAAPRRQRLAAPDRPDEILEPPSPRCQPRWSRAGRAGTGRAGRPWCRAPGRDAQAIADGLLARFATGAGEELAGAVAMPPRGGGPVPPSNEFGDWNTVLHTFTYANAMHQAMGRAPHPSCCAACSTAR